MEEYISQSEACNLTGLTYRTISRLVYKLKKEKSQNLKEVIDNNRKSYRIRKRYLLDKYKLQPQETGEIPTVEDNKPTSDDSKLVEFLKQELEKRDKETEKMRESYEKQLEKKDMVIENLNERNKEVNTSMRYLLQQIGDGKTLRLGESPTTEGEVLNDREVFEVKRKAKTSKPTNPKKQKKPSKPKGKKRNWWGLFS